MLVKMGEDLFRVLDLQHVTPGNLRGFVRAKFRNIRNGTLSDQKLRSEDMVERAMLDERRDAVPLPGRRLVPLHGHESYEQLHIDSEVLGDSVNYMMPEATIKVEFYGTEPVGIELPPTVDLKVEDTAPGIKGATASAQVKPARLETGLVVQVPPFVNTGDAFASAPRRASTCREPEATAVDITQHPAEPRAGSKSSPAACSAARAKSSSAGCAGRRSRKQQGPDLQADDRQPLRRRPHHLAQRDADPVARTCRRRASCSSASMPDTEVVGIDEGQFFDAELPAVCNTLADQGKRVIVAGLDQDYLGKPFEPMPQLLAIAEYITKTLAICMVCGAPGQSHPAPRREQRARAGRRAGHLRSALPALLRSDASGSNRSANGAVAT